MLRNGEPAIFATREEAQCAADTYMREGYPPYEKNGEGYAWRVDPEIEGWFAARDEWPKVPAAARLLQGLGY